MAGGAPRRQDGEESLAEFLGARARRASDGRLAAMAAAGLVAAAASLLWGGSGWMLACATALCLAAFGVWGITDRELNERMSEARTCGLNALRLMRWLAMALGVISGLAALFAALALTLGRWVS